MAQPPRLGLDAIYDVHDYPVLDIRTSNNVLELAPPVVQQSPTLSLRGLLLLAVGVMVGAWTGVRLLSLAWLSSPD